MYDKARKRMTAISGLGLEEGVSVKTMLRGWEVLVRPIVEYGGEIWERRSGKRVKDYKMRWVGGIGSEQNDHKRSHPRRVN